MYILKINTLSRKICEHSLKLAYMKTRDVLVDHKK